MGAADGHELREPGPEKLPVLRGLMKDHRSRERLPQTFLRLPRPTNLSTVSADRWKLLKGPTFIHFGVGNTSVTDTDQQLKVIGVSLWKWVKHAHVKPDSGVTVHRLTYRSKRDGAVVCCPL